MDIILLCAAPGCDRLSFQTKNHCRSHSKEYYPLYNNYKKAQENINQYIEQPIKLESLTIERLLSVLSKFLLVIKLRSNYREKAFRPEYHDRGHEDFIEKLIMFSRSIENILSKKFVDRIPPIFDNNVDLSASDDEVNEVNELQSQPCKKSHKLVSDLRSSLLELESEFRFSMEAKATIIKSIFEEFMECVALINEKLGSDPISINDREARLIYKSRELASDALHRGDTIYHFDARPTLHNPFIVINWEHIPSMELLVESIYNGKLGKLKFLDDEDQLDAFIMLIKESRRHAGDFSFRFILDDGIKIESKNHRSKHYPSKYKIRTLK